LMILTALSFLFLHGTYAEMKYWISLILLLRGASFASFYTAFFTYAADLSLPENRARVIGLFGVSGLIAHGLAPRIAEIVLHQYQFHGFFLISAILSASSLTISAFLKDQRVAAPSTEHPLGILREVTFTRRNIVILPASFVFGYVTASFNTFGAAYFQQAGKGSVGYFFMTYGLVAGFIRIFLGGIADRYPREKLVLAFFALQGAGLCLIVLQPLQYFYLICAAVCGIAHGILFPSMTAMAVDAHRPDFRGVVTSIFTATMDGGFSIGSYILGVVIAITGYKTMFLSAAMFAILLSIYIAFMQTSKGERTPLSVETIET